MPVDLHPAGAADRGAAGAADGERAVVAVFGLQQAIEDRERGVELDLELLPVGALAALGLVALTLRATSASVWTLRHLVGPLLRAPTW